jgi:hypothetical protein
MKKMGITREDAKVFIDADSELEKN